MLPAPQMQPSAVPGSQTFDPITALSLLDTGRPHHDHVRRFASSYRRSFPIRSSQSTAQAAVPTSHHGTVKSEHNLRRKTPRGTVEAGYDGSLNQRFPGPPPFKHMIVPMPATTNSYMPLNTNSGLAHQEWDTNLTHINAYSFSNGSLPGSGHSAILSNGTQTSHSNLLHGRLQLSDYYQPVLRANEHNVRAFCPPPGPINGSFMFGQMGWPSTGSPWEHRNSELNQHLDLGGVSAAEVTSNRYTGPKEPSTYSAMPTMSGGASNVDRAKQSAHITHWSINPYQDINLVALGLGSICTEQPHFREKALTQAQQSYVELLSYLQANGRSNPMKVHPGSRTSHKLPAYPKPPILRGNRGVKGNLPTASQNFHSVDHNVDSLQRSGLLAINNGGPLQQPRTLYGGNNMPVERNSFTAYPKTTIAPSGSVYGNFTANAGPSQISNAISALDILNSLCEQSRWTWIDGMLIGGCLHYALERYENSAKWFSKIVALDSSHVEAMTHMAAALYCLGRQEDAEQHWLKAVKTKPDYLDATEHLVGHLYKNRSGEAVDVISFVQNSLRSMNRKSSTNNSTAKAQHKAQDPRNWETYFAPTIYNPQGYMHDPNPVGFGSSGYLISGQDNGRMLALVHAKGTMLYSLKNIERASEAFEEAVLISIGRRLTGIQELIHLIQTSLCPQGHQPRSSGHRAPIGPLMLPPEKARHTANLAFGSSGELPGLKFLRNGLSRRAAIQTTSNSLLSLAKIFQDTMSTGNVDSTLFRGSSQVGDILALYYLSLSLQESPSTANNVGILLAGIQQANSGALRTPSRTTLPTSIPGISPGSGLALALSYYNYGLRLDPNHVHLHTNLGSLLKDVGQLDLAIQMYERAVSCDGTFDIALTNLANAVKDKGRINDAIVYYQRAVNSNPDFAEAVCGLFTALNSVCSWRGRGGMLLDFGRYDRWHVDINGKLVDAQAGSHASGLAKRVVDIVNHQLQEASLWGRGALQEYKVNLLAKSLQKFCRDKSFGLENALLKWAGQPWEGSRLVRLLERATKVMLRCWYRDLYVSADGSSPHYARPRFPQTLAVPSAPTVLPFHTFTCPLTASQIRSIAQRNAARISSSTLRSPWIPSTLYPPPPPPNPQLNVGYISSDFNNHPLAHLMQSAFGFHNKDRVRAICYATTPSDGSSHRLQIESEAPVFRDVSNWTSDKLLDQITTDKVHILVNLNGYTRGARNEVFAARPAPIQMSFMGFAGTLGAEWCDYILADTTAIPPTTLRPWRDNVSIEDIFLDDNDGTSGNWMYSENVIFCRDTFFCCDHAQSHGSDDSGITWEAVEQRRWEMRKQLFPNIGDDVVILGNFNQLYKIEPTTFRLWLRILARVPKAILWLLRFPEAGESNLLATAKAWAGPEVASRIIFTDVAPKSQHISRARVCDLFLDTPECNAHTTAADVLWSSTPLLTLPRYPYKMCSRMAASILRGALSQSSEGVAVAKQLITGTEEEYEQRAAELAGDLAYTLDGSGYGHGKGRLADIRRLLWDNKWQCGLFNTRRWVADLETAYEEAWRRWVDGVGGDIYL